MELRVWWNLGLGWVVVFCIWSCLFLCVRYLSRRSFSLFLTLALSLPKKVGKSFRWLWWSLLTFALFTVFLRLAGSRFYSFLATEAVRNTQLGTGNERWVSRRGGGRNHKATKTLVASRTSEKIHRTTGTSRSGSVAGWRNSGNHTHRMGGLPQRRGKSSFGVKYCWWTGTGSGNSNSCHKHTLCLSFYHSAVFFVVSDIRLIIRNQAVITSVIIRLLLSLSLSWHRSLNRFSWIDWRSCKHNNTLMIVWRDSEWQWQLRMDMEWECVTHTVTHMQTHPTQTIMRCWDFDQLREERECCSCSKTNHKIRSISQMWIGIRSFLSLFPSHFVKTVFTAWWCWWLRYFHASRIQIHRVNVNHR